MFNKFKNCDISEVWSAVKEPMFENIYRIAQGILSLARSSANVERIFSINNLIKTKFRQLVTANIHTRDLLKANSCFCHNFKINNEHEFIRYFDWRLLD